MLTNSQHKLISSLSSKKYRNKTGLFVVEGEKGIEEFLKSDFELYSLYATVDVFGIDYISITDSELKKISQLKSPNKVLALFKIKVENDLPERGLVVALDSVRDPGNLGTIIRLCDWFGVEHLVCSEDTVDCYNPKVVQATMGSLARTRMHYLNLKTFLSETNLAIYGTVMDGPSIYRENLGGDAILLMGNEANGISKVLLEHVRHFVTIPRFNSTNTVESLNVATATAICLNEFRRNFIEK